MADQRTAATYPVLKRGIDVVTAAAVLLIVSPILAGSLLAVYLDSGRPLIHRRRVVGHGGQSVRRVQGPHHGDRRR